MSFIFCFVICFFGAIRPVDTDSSSSYSIESFTLEFLKATGQYDTDGVPFGFDLSTWVSESANEINVKVTNSNSGELKELIIPKIAAP